MKRLNIKPILQDPRLSYCSLNAVHAVLNFYSKRYTRAELLRLLKTHRTRGTNPLNIEKTLLKYDLFFTKKSNLSFSNIKRSIDSRNVILISYMSDINEAHSSIICGYDKRRGIEYVLLCDSLFGIYEMPFSVLRFLFHKDIDSEAMFFERT